jgi:hypothetical protein
VIIFGSIRFLPKKYNQTGKKKDPKPNQNRPQPIGFGLVFYPKNQKNLYAFFWTFLALLAQCHHEKLKLFHCSKMHSNHRVIIIDRLVNNKTIGRLLSL